MIKDIGIDIDGVLANFTQAISIKLREVYGIEKADVLQPKNVLDWYYTKNFPYLTREEIDKVFEDVIDDHYFWVEMIDVLDWKGLELLKFIINDNIFNIHFITSRPGKYIYDYTYEWLKLKLQTDNFNLHIADSWKDKRAYIEDQNIECFIDDHLETCESLVEVCPVLFKPDYPYNKTTDKRIKNGGLFDYLIYVLDYYNIPLKFNRLVKMFNILKKQ